MPQVTYIEQDGTRHAVDVPIGTSLMQGALNTGVPGIEGDCGGAAACATCHVHVADAWRALVGGPSELEVDMLDCANEVDESSRLSCQIVMDDALDGIEVVLPTSQR